MSLPPIGGLQSDNLRIFIVDYLRVLYRRRWLAAAVFVSVVSAVAVYTYRTIPIYEAQVSVLIEPEMPKVVNFTQVLDEAPSLGAYMQTQEQLLTSRAMAIRTAESMQLWTRAGFGSTPESAADAVRGGLLVSPLRGTRMIHIRFRSPDPATAADIANAHARTYLQESLDRRLRASRQATEWLDVQLAEERRRVEAADAALQAFRENHDAVSLEEGQNIVVQKLVELNAAVTRAKTDRIEKEAQYREIQAARDDPAALSTFPAVLSSGFIEQLKGTIAQLQRDQAQLSETFGDLHPRMVEMRTALDTAEKRLAAEVARVVESVRKAYDSAVAEEQSLLRALDEQKREALALNRRGIEYAALEREAQSMRLVYQSLLQRAKETGVSEELRATNIQIVDPARRPRTPIEPRTTFNMFMSLITGTLLAIGAVFLVELMDDRIKVPADLAGYFPQPLLGLIPEVRRKQGVRASLARRDTPRELVEAFRGLRTSLLASMPAGQRRSILVASAAQREGKTHVASNLAIALAQAQHRVLLIDADMRRPRVHEHLDHRLEPGLSNVLTGASPLADALQQASVPHLTVLTAGNASNEAPELLGSDGFTALLRLMEEHFDWVIVDSPPALSVTDSSLIAQRTAGVVFVVGSDLTKGRAARLAVNELQRVGGRVIGVVLNRADIAHHPFYFEPYAPGEYLESLEALPPESPHPASILGGGRL